MERTPRLAHPIADRWALLLTMFFGGWLAATVFYDTDTWQRAKATGYFGSVPALQVLTNEVGRCEATLDKHNLSASKAQAED